jgi:hypothetical protein
MTLLRACWSLICAWWWSLAVDHVDAHHPDLPLLCQRRKRHADRVRNFLANGANE